MKNWKTALGGLLALSGKICQALGLPEEVGDAVMVIGIFLIGMFAKDNDKTGKGM